MQFKIIARSMHMHHLISITLLKKFIIIIDLAEHRLTVAKNLGADYTVKVSMNATTEDLALEVEKTLGSQPDISIDACGAQSTISLCMLATRSGGTMCIVGHGPAEVNVPIVKAVVREVDIRGVFRYANW